MKKKFLALLLSCVMLTLCACGQTDAPANENGDSPSVTSDAPDTPDDSDAPAAKPGVPEPTVTTDESGLVTTSYELDVTALEADTVIYDNNFITITVTEVKPSAEDSSCKDVTLFVQNDNWYTMTILEGDPDGTVHSSYDSDTLCWDSDTRTLEYVNIKDTLYLSVTTLDKAKAPDIMEKVTLNVDKLQEGTVIYDNNGLTLTISSIWERDDRIDISCTAENNTGYEIGVTGMWPSNNIKINDTLFYISEDDPIWSYYDFDSYSLNTFSSFSEGTNDAQLLYINKQDCAHLGIESIDKIEFEISIEVYDQGNHGGTELPADIVTLE